MMHGQNNIKLCLKWTNLYFRMVVFHVLRIYDLSITFLSAA